MDRLNKDYKGTTGMRWAFPNIELTLLSCNEPWPVKHTNIRLYDLKKKQENLDGMNKN